MWVAIWIIFFVGIHYLDAQAMYNWWYTHWSYYDDHMSKEDKDKLHVLSREFIHKMQLLQRQLLPIKRAHVNKISYQVGLVIGTLREKYKRMMDTYLEADRRYTDQMQMVGPAAWENLPMHYELAMETIRKLEVEIHKYIDLLTLVPDDDFEEKNSFMSQLLGPTISGLVGNPLRSGLRTKPTGGKPAVKRASSTIRSTTLISVPKTAKPALTEENVKRQLRENYMKQHGIDETDWSLDRHYGFI